MSLQNRVFEPGSVVPTGLPNNKKEKVDLDESEKF